MQVHYVIAHPRPDSFNVALLEIAKKTFPVDQLTVTDLYKMQFKAVASQQDLEVAAKDVAAELTHIHAADLLILQFPLWWFSMPAILKGWMDRVFVKGVAYDSNRLFETGGFAGKKAMLVFTTQATEIADPVFFPMHHALHFVGFETLDPFVGYAVATRTHEENEKLLKEYQLRLEGLITDQSR